MYFCPHTLKGLMDRAHMDSTHCPTHAQNQLTIMAGRTKKEAAPDTKKEIKKGQATGKPPKAKDEIKACTQLYEVVQTRGVNGATLNSIDECINYVAEYMNFCEKNPYIQYEILKGGASAGQKVPVEKKRAPSVGGFCLFIGWSVKDFNKNMVKLEKASETNPDAENLLLGYTLIKELITTEMDESALAGVVDANYMAKAYGDCET